MKCIVKIIIISILIIVLAACTVPEPVPTETLAPTETLVPTQILTPTETETPIATPTILAPQLPEFWDGVLKARAPSLEEINKDSVWIALGIDAKDMQTPGLEMYSGIIQKDKEYLFPIYWCAKTADVFHANMQAVFTELVVNDEIIPEKYIFNYNYNDDSGWFCNYRSVMLSGWQPNIEYVLEMRRVISQALSDGETNYEPGNYIYQLKIIAQ